MTAFGWKLVAALLLIAGGAVAAVLLNVGPVWVGAGTLVAIVALALAASKRPRVKESAAP